MSKKCKFSFLKMVLVVGGAVGKTNVSKKALPLSEIEQLYRDRLEPGGRFRPANCRANYKVAIVIPYRDRQEHLSVFLQHMHPFLQRQQLDYGIYVVQQSGNYFQQKKTGAGAKTVFLRQNSQSVPLDGVPGSSAACR